MQQAFQTFLEQELDTIAAAGLLKRERQIISAQGSKIRIAGADRDMINLCANNYLGLANDPRILTAAKAAMDTHGYGLASVRFICGTQDLHRILERRIAAFLEKDDAILFAACFDANGALFEPLLGEDDAIVSDSLNHASIIDDVRLCRARRFRFANNDMADLEAKLRNARNDGARFILIATDGVFSMDGSYARLPEICALADKFQAMVMVDDCHATGVIGSGGRGTPWHFGVSSNVDILTGTLGKALGGGLGGYIAGPAAVIDLLRQKARPYLFSNSLPPAILGASLAAFDILQESCELRLQLAENTKRWRDGLAALGFDLLPGGHPIVPIMTYEARAAAALQDALLAEGVFATAFSYPVVPKGRARVRTQMNAAFTERDIDIALVAFARAGRRTGLIHK